MKPMPLGAMRLLERLEQGRAALALGQKTDEHEVVCEGLEVWIGSRRSSWSALNALLRVLAVSDQSDRGSTFLRFSINDVGRAILRDQSQADVVRKMIASNTQFTVRNFKITPIGDP
jgi:hypothetical protein